jgi:hypothetical protein
MNIGQELKLMGILIFTRNIYCENVGYFTADKKKWWLDIPISKRLEIPERMGYTGLRNFQ